MRLERTFKDSWRMKDEEVYKADAKFQGNKT